ncbi:MAG: hypothetical protein H6R16_1452 [Proteobacteria bacterium]|nr:hypothetical protein [Pseudomonadota bacterium]
MIPVIWRGNNSYNSVTFVSLKAVSLGRFGFRYSASLLMLALSGSVFAVGLGDLRGQPVLGSSIRLEIALLGMEKQQLDVACFRLIQPEASSDLPWLKKASLTIRKGVSPVLEIRSEAPLREPIMQLAVQLGCGHEISRDYVVMASPAREGSVPAVEPRSDNIEAQVSSHVVRKAVRTRSVTPVAVEPPPRLSPRKSGKRLAETLIPDRLVLSEAGDVGDPSLRLATELQPGAGVKEAQREILRLEFRMLLAMHEQATSQMAAAEKLRNMEGTLGELQQRAGEFAQRVEKEGAVPIASEPLVAVQPVPVPGPVANVPVRPQPSSPVPVLKDFSGPSDWGFYGALLGAVLGLAGWFGWRKYRERQPVSGEVESPIDAPEMQVDPKRAEEREELGGIDLPFEAAAMGVPMQVDLELDGRDAPSPMPLPEPESSPARAQDSILSINATTLDEHFEANPVMELADIMLSFGRVKGAAQALQEFIDHNPQEALQPWIRLMDVYRMAGMRTEFENVAHNLNLNFNVEVQSWDGGKPALAIAAEGDADVPVAPRPQSLEDLPRLMQTVVELWESGDVVGYLYQLLRDNRGGQRQGFALPVVEDVLFLIELKETSNRME